MTTRLEIERRPLGASGFEAPRIMLGCGNFGGVGSAPAFFGRGQSEDEAFATNVMGTRSLLEKPQVPLFVAN